LGNMVLGMCMFAGGTRLVLKTTGMDEVSDPLLGALQGKYIRFPPTRCNLKVTHSSGDTNL
jgi:hypothetical protein